MKKCMNFVFIHVIVKCSENIELSKIYSGSSAVGERSLLIAGSTFRIPVAALPMTLMSKLRVFVNVY